MYRSKLILLAALVIGASLVCMQAASAVGMHKAGAGPAYMDQLTKALNLTPDQVSKIQAIHQNAKVQKDAVVADKSLTVDARRAKLMELHKSMQSQVMAVLTPDQQAKYTTFMAQRRAKWADKMSALGLTPDQQARIKSIRETSRKQIAAVRADTTLTPAARQAKVRDILTASREQIRQVLTPEQRSKLDAARSNRMK